MDTSALPHFLLFSEAECRPWGRTRWHFALESVDSDQRMSAADDETCDGAERAELLAVVRGLEALQQPSRVTLVTKSRYVARGISRGLEQWRHGGWRWERFGKQVPIRDQDLWKRVDRALEFHSLECRRWSFSRVTGEADLPRTEEDGWQPSTPRVAGGSDGMKRRSSKWGDDRPAAPAVASAPARMTGREREATPEKLRRSLVWLSPLTDLFAAKRLRVWPTMTAIAAVAWLT